MNDPDLWTEALHSHAAALAQITEEVRFPKGMRLFAAGEPGDACYLIDAGEVRIEVAREELDSDGILAYLGPGQTVGEIALLDRQPRSAHAWAHTDVTARRIDAAGMEALARTHPEAVLALMTALARDAVAKLRRTTEKFAEAVFPERDPEVDAMVTRAMEAQRVLAGWSEAQVDALIADVAQAIAVASVDLAEAAVSESRYGNVPDKAFKNQVASVGVARTLLGQPGLGSVGEGGPGVTEIAAPVGVVFGMIPQTNPVATAAFKTLICLKSRNAILLSFHHAVLETAARFGAVVQPVLEAHGAPLDLVQWVRARTSRKKTAAFMAHEGVGLILATGGMGMVKATYSSGTPALGVGPGNAPVLVTPGADLDQAARAVVLSKSFDNGLICGSEHNLVVVEEIREAFLKALEHRGAAVLDPEESERFAKGVVHKLSGTFHPRVVGKGADRIAESQGIERPFPIRLIVVPISSTEVLDGWASEKMAPVLSLYTVPDVDAGFHLCRRILEHQGAGHTAILHARREDWIERFGREMPVSRILINSPGSHGVVGYTTGLLPSLTLGCGTFGGNSTTDNVGYRNLLNIKRLARFVDPIERGFDPAPGWLESA
jgi:acyl-CoA reductase-like NAD-dependent aldehyde dehydrogenase